MVFYCYFHIKENKNNLLYRLSEKSAQFNHTTSSSLTSELIFMQQNPKDKKNDLRFLVRTRSEI